MEILGEYGIEGIAKVFLGRNRNSDECILEFTESFQRPLSISEKWVITVSTLYGCPIGCQMCDAGWTYHGKLTADEILMQIEHVVRKRFPDGKVPSKKFKIQFARVGEPALNPDAVLEVLERLPNEFDAPGLMPCISTVAPAGCESFFEKLLEVKDRLYNKGNFQLQFSVHTTDPLSRDRLIPAKKWSLGEISEYGMKFRKKSDRKTTLNFVAMEGCPVDARVIRENFEQEHFVLKFTPLNPTKRAKVEGLSQIAEFGQNLRNPFKEFGFETILSIGDLEENWIGSNCGQVLLLLERKKWMEKGQERR